MDVFYYFAKIPPSIDKDFRNLFKDDVRRIDKGV